jgi:predicted  nucleic acid-binding Zn-ribbon protein
MCGTIETLMQRMKGGLPMPTQEERLTTVEYGLKQFKTETIKAYGETAIELVMVKGLTEDAVKRLASLKTQIDRQSEQVNTQLEAIDAHLSFLQEHTAKTDKRLDSIETQLTQHTILLNEHKTLLTQILARLPEKP